MQRRRRGREREQWGQESARCKGGRERALLQWLSALQRRSALLQWMSALAMEERVLPRQRELWRSSLQQWRSVLQWRSVSRRSVSRRSFAMEVHAKEERV